jgi:hypothetical protein
MRLPARYRRLYQCPSAPTCARFSSTKGGVLMPGPAHATRIHPLCYEHHLEMALRKHSSTEEYACPQPGCLVHYSKIDGYFLDTQDRFVVKGSPAPPHQYCPKDSYPMYLLEVEPNQPSFRLWRCPECNMSRCSGQIPSARPAPISSRTASLPHGTVRHIKQRGVHQHRHQRHR